MEGNTKAEARGTEGRETLRAPKLVGVRQVEGDGARQVEGDQLLGVRRGETNCLARAPFSALADAEALLRRARIPTPPNAAGRRDEATWPRRLIGREQSLGAKNTPALDGAPCRLVLH